MANLIRTTPNNVWQDKGNNLSIYIDPEGVCMLLDSRGTTQPLTDYVSGTGGNFIKNQTTAQASANFNIDGKGAVGGAELIESFNILGKLQLIDDASNVSIGFENLMSNIAGNFNIAIGSSSLYSNTIGSLNIAIGINTLHFNTEGYNNIALGFDALSNNITGVNNLAIGVSSMAVDDGGENNIALGFQALGGSTGNILSNIAIGSNSLFNAHSPFHNVAIGENTLSNGGENNVAIGYYSNSTNTDGINNTTIGAESFSNNVGGNDNVAIGFSCLKSITNSESNYNTAIGSYAMYNSNFANNNVVIGYNAGNNYNGDTSVIIGDSAFPNTAVGNDNSRQIIIGYQACFNADKLNQNIVIGNRAAMNINDANKNIVIGYESGINNTNPSVNSNIVVGFSNQFDYDNCLILANNGIATKTNQIVIGSASDPLGDVSLGTIVPNNYMEVLLNGVICYIPIFIV